MAPHPRVGQSLQVTTGCQDHSLKLALSLVLSDVIRYFNPSVLKPICPLGTGAVGRAAAEAGRPVILGIWMGGFDGQLDFQNDWKLINVFFSNASQCHLCSSTQQVNRRREAEGLQMLGWHRIHTHFWLVLTCSPTAQPCRCSGETSRLSSVVTQWAYQETWERLLASSKYNEQESFVVVFQPFFYERALPEARPTPSPAPDMDSWIVVIIRYLCLQENPYLFTYRNSNYLPRMLKPQVKTEVRRGKKITPVLFSFQAGNGAGSKPGNVLDVLTQYRGLSWSVGGDQNLSSVITLPNMLREFNPSLKGFSVGKGTESSSGAYLNQAVAGARAEDLPVQARRLVDLMKNDKNINFQEDWKIITLFIGGNDLCDVCDDPVRYSPQNFVDNIGQALDILHAEVPRAFVNLVKVLEIINLRKLYQEKNVSCPRLILRNLCPCVLKYDDNATELASLIEVNKKYQEGTHQLVESGRYDTREDFTVVVQPFFEKVDMPMTPEGLPDNSYFAPDCFHFSSKAHAHAASALWNNMLPPHRLKCVSVFPVHTLRPADIQVVAALGDSLTAGNGIGSKPNDLSDVTTQYRGLSYSSGGDSSLENVTTLPNILRKFNGNLTGYAVGTGDANETNAFLNQAVPGAKAEELVNQVQTLIQKMKSDHRVNFHEDWKVITVLIGGNDLCDYCTDSNLYSADNFFDHLRNALDILHKEVPRALVNLVDFMSPSIMRQVFLGNPDKCPVHQASILCNCVLTPRESSQELAKLESITRAYQSSMRELVESGRYETREDFSVVLQPFFYNIRLPVLADGRPDVSFFAPDCLHPMGFPVSAVVCLLFDFLCTEQNPSNSVPTSGEYKRYHPPSVKAHLGALSRPYLDPGQPMTNILKKFNPNILGFSTGTQEETAGLNVAAEGARARDMPAQARDLVERMKTSPEINLQKDWKLITLFIGSNDLCHYCDNEARSAEEYVKYIRQALDILYEQLPRAFINVVEVMELADLHQGQDGKCVMPLPAQSNCTCLQGSQENLPEMQELKTVNWDFQSALSTLSYQYLQREDFAVVVQPFFQNTLVPLNKRGGADLTFFSEDCFHFSERGHAEMAIALWNNMLEPVGHKTTSNNFTYSRTKLKCPSAENPYLRTLRNSQLLQNQADTEPPVLSWAVPVAAGGGLVVGVGAVMTWRALRGRQNENSPLSLNTMSF
uniref:Phospholipase B1, membrane-associated n=1 Tax=Capra hircus TaxID=9925 RepID=A0A452FKE2_CAPHI